MDTIRTTVFEDPNAGNGLAASEDIDAGEVIVQLSSPYLLIVEKEALEKVCSFCLLEASSEDPQLKRCSACKIPRYCSSECQKKDWAAVHQKECPLLKTLPGIPPTPVRALMQVLLRHSVGNYLDTRWAGLESHINELKKDRKRWEEIVLQAQAAVAFSKSAQDRLEVAIQVLCRMITNAFRATLADDTPVGLCFEPILALANHSCSPNAVVMFDGRSVALRALEPASKGEQLFISYITATEDRLSRQTALKQRYFFDCQCEKCSKDESPYSTFLRYVPKAEGRIDLFCNSKHLINEASDLIKVTGGLISDLTRANQYLQQGQALAEQRASKEQVLKKGANSCNTKHKQFALHPFPRIMHELYLNYLDISSFINALIVLLFLFLNCDVYNYPQIHHPVRVIRLFAIAKLLKHISSLSPESIQSLSGDIKEHVTVTKAIDWIDSFHTIMILVWEQGSKSHGKESRFMMGVETELREVEEVQRLRGEVGGRLRKWMGDADILEGKKEAIRILEELKKLSGCAWEILHQNSEE